jgi:hypothetical protein
MPNPWVSLRWDQLIAVNQVLNVKEQLEKGMEVEEEKKRNSVLAPIVICIQFYTPETIDKSTVSAFI